jgi:cell division protease FtsH
MIISEKEKQTTAYHEAGHALVALLVGDEADPVHKVTIIPRGRALGLTQQLPTEDRLSMTREFALNRICIMMGGRCAEEIVFNQRTTGAGNDIEQATDLARKMVTEWGMSEEIGPLNFSRGQNEVFLGRDFAQHDAYSEETARKIDGEIRRICTDQHKKARELLAGNQEALERIAQALLEHETLTGAEIETLFPGGKIDRRSPSIESRGDVAGVSEKKKRPILFPPITPVGKNEPDPEPA